MKTFYNWIIAFLLLFCKLGFTGESTIAEERSKLLLLGHNCLELEKQISRKEANEVLRRTAFRLLAQNYPKRAIELGLADDDAVIRVATVFLIGVSNTPNDKDKLLKMLNDVDSRVRYAAFHNIRKLAGDSELSSYTALMNDTSARIRESVNRIIWPLFRKNQLLKDDPNYDHPLVLSLRRNLEMGSRVSIRDPGIKGVDASWHKPGKVNATYNNASHKENEVEFHRIEFDLNETSKFNAVELVLQGLPENSWAYLNGKYLGQRNLAPAQEIAPWRLNVASEINFAGKNVLVVRLLNSNRHKGFQGPLLLECFN